MLSVHGLNTTGPWQKHITPILSDHMLKCVPVDYGFNTLRAIRPRKLLSRAVDAFITDYERHADSEVPVGAIGHSFGTLVLGYALSAYRDLQVKRIILAGSILKRAFDWESLIEAGQVEDVLNEVSRNDYVVRFCPLLHLLSFFSLPIGLSGSHGFSARVRQVQNRWHSAGHSGVLRELTCKRAWIPLIRGDCRAFDLSERASSD